MTFEELKQKALHLPMSPGVYIMRDASDTVIYVGKAVKLKNRVSQYFQDTASHSEKTRRMVSNIHHFDVIIASSEFDALVLECSLIKQHMPKYNILLKDDKGYPYLRLNMNEPYPNITLVSKPLDDGAAYFGPYGSRGVTRNILDTIQSIFKLPLCAKRFPRDLQKGRVCLNYHMDQCAGWCQRNDISQYRDTIEQARQLLLGKYKEVAQGIRAQMLQASDEMNFELAAQLRNRLHAVEALGQKQLSTAGKATDTDVIGLASSETKTCFTVMHYLGGKLVDKDYVILPLQDNNAVTLNSLVKQYYLRRGFTPKQVLLPMDMPDKELFEQLVEQEYGHKTRFLIPQRGDKVRLVELARENAFEEAQRVTTKEERLNGTLTLLSKLLSIPVPRRIESYDISNISGTDIVASMVVFQEGKPKKSEYKRFKIKDMDGQDDYACMRQVLTRRLQDLKDKKPGFIEKPDLILVDGGMGHVQIAAEVLQQLDLQIPVFGMVKDDRHRTRALINPGCFEIGINMQPAVFSFIGSIQEETHRFAITFHRNLRSKRLRHSQLDKIPTIGPKRKEDLLRRFKSVSAIKQATLAELEQVLPRPSATVVYEFFHKGEGE